jgi:hypothetical protein
MYIKKNYSNSFSVIFNANKIDFHSNFLEVEWDTKILKKMFNFNARSNKVHFYFNFLGLIVSFGTKEITISCSSRINQAFWVTLISFLIHHYSAR